MAAVRGAVQERTIELTTGTAHYFETGEGYPTILIHGVAFTAGGAEWFGCFKEGLGTAGHLFAIDQYGFGGVERRVQRYEFGYLVDHVRELQDALGFEKTNIVGHSLGGWVAATLAYESPERVNRLALVANAGLNTAPPPNLANFEAPTRESLEEGVAHIADLELREELLAQRIRNAELPGAVEAYRRISEMFVDTDMRQRYFLTRRLAHIRAETLLVFGERDLIFPPVEGRELMHREIADSRMVVLPDTGHAVTTERPAELTALLKDFLA